MKGVFCNDLMLVLQTIMETNTRTNRDDFLFDIDCIQLAATQNKAEKRCLFWLSRPCGTICAFARDVFLLETFTHIHWTHYENAPEVIRALALEVGEAENGIVSGTVYELDYPRHVEAVKKAAIHVFSVDVSFLDGYTETVSYSEFENGCEVELLEKAHGKVCDFIFHPQNESELNHILFENFPMPRDDGTRPKRPSRPRIASRTKVPDR